MPYRHFWYAWQRTALNSRRVRGQEEISTRREAQQIAVTSARKMSPGFFAGFLGAFFLVIFFDSPMVKPNEIAGRGVSRRQQFKVAIRSEDAGRSKFG